MALTLPLWLASVGAARAQQQDEIRAFAPGEVLWYRAVSGRIGQFGSGVMRVAGPVEVRGRRALELSFDFQGRVGVFRVEDRSRSWVLAEGLSSLRYTRSESSPLGSRSEEVEIFPEEGRWENGDGASRETDCPHPLDELSFLYYLRSLPLADGAEYSLTHHFDPRRNPVTLRVLRRERTTVPAGEFATVVVEMHVRDDHVAAMCLYLTDDSFRIPVRIESSAPLVGSTRLLLERVDGAPIASRLE